MAAGASIFYRLWQTHPRLAAVIHLLFSLLLVAASVDLWSKRATWGAAPFATLAAVSITGVLVWFTIDAANRGWRPEGADQPIQGPKA